MTKPVHEMSSWDASAQPVHAVEEDEAWAATRAQTGMATQWLRDKDEPLQQRQIGRQIGPALWELFVVVDAATALQQQFAVLQPEFIALHDIGTPSSRRLLAGLAAACAQPVHQLHIRRQGLGVPLAQLEFVELPLPAGLPPLRLYTTAVDADTQQRHKIALTLLAHSRLGAVIVGDLPPHALTTALQPLHEAMRESAWLNRDMLMLPLANATTLARQTAQLASGSAVHIRSTPQVTRPAEAWAYLRDSWNKLRGPLREQAIHLPELLDPPRPTGALSGTPASAAPAEPPATMPGARDNALVPPAGPVRDPLPMRPMPTVRAAAVTPLDPALADYIRQCFEIKGLLSGCVFDLSSQRSLAQTGTRPGPAALASQGAALMTALAEAAHSLHLSNAAPEAVITLGAHHQLLRAIPHRPGLALHAVLDRSTTNLTLMRLQLQRLDLLLTPGPAA